jgi:hypothetical protein
VRDFVDGVVGIYVLEFAAHPEFAELEGLGAVGPGGSGDVGIFVGDWGLDCGEFFCGMAGAGLGLSAGDRVDVGGIFGVVHFVILQATGAYGFVGVRVVHWIFLGDVRVVYDVFAAVVSDFVAHDGGGILLQHRADRGGIWDNLFRVARECRGFSNGAFVGGIFVCAYNDCGVDDARAAVVARVNGCREL